MHILSHSSDSSCSQANFVQPENYSFRISFDQNLTFTFCFDLNFIFSEFVRACMLL